MAIFTDPDTQDFFDAWLASKRDPDAFLELRQEAYGAGWDAAIRAVREARLYEQRIVDEERAQEARWNRFQPGSY